MSDADFLYYIHSLFRGEVFCFSVKSTIELCFFTPIFICSVIVFLIALATHLFSRLIRLGGSKPKFYYRTSDFSRHLEKRIPQFKRCYVPPFWARHPLIQTFCPSSPFQQVDVFFEREYLQLKDRGLIALDWAVQSYYSPAYDLHLRESTPVLLIVPPLTSSSVSYNLLCREVLARGFRPVVFNQRGQGGCPLVTPRLQTHGDPSDLRQATQFIRYFLPHAPITALGYGSGSDLLLAYLGEFGVSSFIAACAAVSPMYDPSRLYDDDIAKVYKFLRLLKLRHFLGSHWKALDGVINYPAAMNSSTLEDFDRHLFWKMNGYDDEDEYWGKNAPLRDIDEISVPLLCISSRDDPYVPEDSIPFDIFNIYPNLFLAVTEKGGHCGFLQNFSSFSWAEMLALDFLKATIEFSKSNSKRSKPASR